MEPRFELPGRHNAAENLRKGGHLLVRRRSGRSGRSSVVVRDLQSSPASLAARIGHDLDITSRHSHDAAVLRHLI
jgi:hypothetical protein